MIDFVSSPTKARISLRTYMRAQARLMPAGQEMEWIERNAGAFRAWVESLAEIVANESDTINEQDFMALARNRMAWEVKA